MPAEIELKLRVAPERVARLRRDGLLRSLALRRATTRRMTSVYFDTPDLALSRQGVALRIRHVGSRRIQTVKAPWEGGPAMTQAFHEFESPVAADLPDLGLIADEPLRKALDSPYITASLAPLFVTEIARTAWPTRLLDSDIEVVLDLGEIRAGDRRMPLAELELELKSGAPERLFELALKLLEATPLTLEYESKAARGHRLAANEEPAPRRASIVPLPADMTAAAAFVALAGNCLHQLHANEACALRGEDPEGVHQLRVGLRRLRALIGACRKLIAEPVVVELVPELQWLQEQLGPARDWDVFIDETLHRMPAHLPKELSMAATEDAAQVLRSEAHATLRAALQNPRYTRLQLRLGQLLASGGWRAANGIGASPGEQLAMQFAGAVLDKRYKRVHKLGGKHADLGEDDLHRLRLLCKKLRYVAEFFRALYPRKAAKRHIAALAAIQERLGSLNDAVVSRDLLRLLEQRIAASDNSFTAMRVTALVLGWQAARIDHDLVGFRELWRDFRGRPPFWR